MATTGSQGLDLGQAGKRLMPPDLPVSMTPPTSPWIRMVSVILSIFIITTRVIFGSWFYKITILHGHFSFSFLLNFITYDREKLGEEKEAGEER